MLTRTRPLLALVPIVLVTVLSPVGTRPALAVSCDAGGADAAAVDAARVLVQGTCDCAGVPNVRTWRRCVQDTLDGPGAAGLSDACRRYVRRIEKRSTCGLDDRIVCCRTNAPGRTFATRRRPGHCPAPPGGSSCESAVPYVVDACVPGGCALPATCGDFVVDPGESCDPPDGSSCSASCHLCLPDGCIAPSSCGNGTIDADEACDPPNGTTCSRQCTACAPASAGEILIGCTAGSTAVDASALPGTLLVAYGDTTPGGVSHALAKRLDNDGTILDATPLAVSGQLPGSTALGGFVQAVSSDDQRFYVAWFTFASFFTYFGGRSVPASGPLASAPELIASDFPFGSCRVSMAGPLNLAPRLADDGFHFTWRVVYSCMAQILFEHISGVGPFFSVPPGNVSNGPAPIVRGASDVAAVWWNIGVASLDPPLLFPTLAASFVEPGGAVKIDLTSGSSPVAPALAAVGDVFVAFFASGNELRAVRFTRADGALDPQGGLLITTAAGSIGEIAASSDGTDAVVAWRDGTGAIRALRVAPDGTVVDAAPIEVAPSGGAIAVAANPSATLVAFTRPETGGSSVRAVLLQRND